MADPVGPQDGEVVLKFGGGVHSRASEDEIDEREGKFAKNLKLDVENREFRNRAPFDLIGTAPNAGRINGFITLVKSDGTAKLAVQAGDKVYDYDGLSSFTDIGTVNSGAKLRGRLESNWRIADKVLITDLSLVEQVKEWDGTTFQNVVFTDEASSPFGDFFAKYCFVSKERAVFGHVKDASATIEHMIVGCKRGDFTNITVSQRPSSGLNAQDPWFILTPDLYPINGLISAFNRVSISTERGSFYQLFGADATDFSIDELHPRSFASGEEAVVYIGNDVLYGRQGRIESLSATEKFGDVSSDDVSFQIADQIEDYKDWTLCYNSRPDRVYCLPGGTVSELWVLHKALAKGTSLTDPAKGKRDVSPWMLWTTEHSISMNPTAMQTVIDPQDGLEYVLMGDSSGNIYRLEGSGVGDAGSADITAEFLSKLFVLPSSAQSFNVEGYIKYRKGEAATVSLTFEYGGFSVVNETVTISLPAVTDQPVYGGDFYYGDFFYGAPFAGRLTRQVFSPAGQSNEFQIRVVVTGSSVVEINEIGVRLTAAS